jgi:hypothetical protein
VRVVSTAGSGLACRHLRGLPPPDGRRVRRTAARSLERTPKVLGKSRRCGRQLTPGGGMRASQSARTSSTRPVRPADADSSPALRGRAAQARASPPRAVAPGFEEELAHLPSSSTAPPIASASSEIRTSSLSNVIAELVVQPVCNVASGRPAMAAERKRGASAKARSTAARRRPGLARTTARGVPQRNRTLDSSAPIDKFLSGQVRGTGEFVGNAASASARCGSITWNVSIVAAVWSPCRSSDFWR